MTAKGLRQLHQVQRLIRWLHGLRGRGSPGIDGNTHRVAPDAVDARTVLMEYAGELRAMHENWPKIKLHAQREHAGLMFQKQLSG